MTCGGVGVRRSLWKALGERTDPPWGWTVGLKGGAAEWIVVFSFVYLLKLS